MMQRLIRVVIQATGLSVLLVSCAVKPVVTEVPAGDAATAAQSLSVPTGSENEQVFGVPEQTAPVNNDVSQKEATIFPGRAATVALPQQRAPLQLDGEGVTLNFENTPLIDVVHGVLGDILGLDYVVEGQIPGEITLRSHKPIPRNELLELLESLLGNHKIVMLRTEGDRFIIRPVAGAATIAPRFDNPSSRGAGFSQVIVPLEHIGALPMTEILKPVAPESAFVRIDPLRNILILAGTRNQLKGWMEIIDSFDVDLLAGMSVGIFPIEYSDVEEVKTALDTLLASAPGDQGSALTGLVRIVPLDSLGSILAVSAKESYLNKIKKWIERLDRAPELGAEPQLFVYSVQNSVASHLAQLLSSIFGGAGTAGSSGSAGGGANQGLAPGLSPSNLSSSGNSSTLGSASNSGNSGNRGATKNRGGSGAASYLLGDTVRVVADEVNNSLLIYATGSEYRKISTALDKLDVMPSQILIEASIIEVTLTDDLRFGLEWYFDNNFKGDWTGDGYIGMGPDANGDIAGFGLPQFGYALTNPLGQIQAVLNTISTKDLVKVLSTPSIMVLDNHAASIHVGTQQPIRSSTTQNGTSTTTSVSYRDTGVKLNVVPSVNSGGLVTMDLIQSVTDIGAADEATGQASFFERNIESRVAVRSGESVVLGGLISDNQSRGKTGLPFLMDLPLIGNLFGSTNTRENRTELLVIITPHVMKSDQDIRNVTEEMKSRMKGLDLGDFERVGGKP